MPTQNWKLTLAYDGSSYHGWQVQPGKPTVQGALSDAIARVTGEQVLPQGAGRTDAGVHATGQVASFSLAAAIPADNLVSALNRVLPVAIRVIAASPVTESFHARHSAVGKIYQYCIFQGSICPPFQAPYVTHVRWPLDVEIMNKTAAVFSGDHDFTSFAASDPDRTERLEGAKKDEASPDGQLAGQRSNVRHIDRSVWSCVKLPRHFGNPAFPVANPSADDNLVELTASEPSLLTYTVQGNGFLHHMVRNLVGTMIEAGRGRIAVEGVARILEGKNRSLAGPTAPSRGLCLMKVLYPDDEVRIAEKSVRC